MQDFDKSIEQVETTIGELIEAVTEVALATGNSREEGYELASLAISKILQDNNIEIH